MNNGSQVEKHPEQEAYTGAIVGERMDAEVLDSVIVRCKTINDALVLSMNMGGFNIKEASYLIGYGEHPEQVSRMLNPDGPFPARLLNLWMDKIGNEIPLRYLNLSRGYGMVRLSSYLEKRNEELEKEGAAKDERIRILEDLLKKRD